MMGYIYKIVCIENNKKYIGQTIQNNVKFRWNRHKSDLKLNRHANQYLQNAWNKYGKDSFKFDIIEEIDSIDKLNNKEEELIKKLKTHFSFGTGFNLQWGGNNKKHSKNSILKMSISTKKWYKNNKTPNKGKSWEEIYGKEKTKEMKANMSKCIKKYIEENGVNFKGESHTEETKRKLSKAHSGKTLSKEHRKNLSIAQKERYKNNKHHNAKKIKDLRTGKIYESQREASRQLNITQAAISYHCTKSKDPNYAFVYDKDGQREHELKVTI